MNIPSSVTFRDPTIVHVGILSAFTAPSTNNHQGPSGMLLSREGKLFSSLKCKVTFLLARSLASISPLFHISSLTALMSYQIIIERSQIFF